MEGSHVLDRVLRYGPAASRGLRPRVVPASLVLMVRTVLLSCLGLGTLHAKTIRPDDRTVVMAADGVHKGSVKTIDMRPGNVGWSSRGIPRPRCHGLARLPTRKLCAICDSSRQWSGLFGGSHH